MDFTQSFDPANGGGAGLAGFDAAAPAPEYAPLPPGIYSARVVFGEFTQTKSGAEAYRIRFEILEGERAGKMVVRTWTFGPKALPYTKRDLAAFGLMTSAHLLSPFPPLGKDCRCRLIIAVQRGDDGLARNDIKKIDNIRFSDSPAAAFMLPPPPAVEPKQGEGGAK